MLILDSFTERETQMIYKMLEFFDEEKENAQRQKWPADGRSV